MPGDRFLGPSTEGTADRTDLLWHVAECALPAHGAGWKQGVRMIGSISALYRHRRQHVHCAGMGVPELKIDRLAEAVIFEYRQAHTRAMDMPSAMPISSRYRHHISGWVETGECP